MTYYNVMREEQPDLSVHYDIQVNGKNDPLSIYREESLRVAVQAMCRWNRNPASPSCGSFDRSWWGWKSRDFSDSTLQAAVTLVLNLADSQEWGWMMPDLLTRYVDFVAKLQHSDGSFDQCYPNERTPGVFYDILPALIAVHSSPWLETVVRQRLGAVIMRGIDFALAGDEVHGEIVNHLAHFAYGLLLHWQTFSDFRSRLRAEAYIERILRNFNAEEGWFQEYHGPDPGYQTRTIAYLTKIAEILDDESLWQVCAQAARFVELMLMPDGSLHPMLGVRSTALIYPSGFERLGSRNPDFLPLARRIRAAWSNNRVPLPSQLDFDNALRLGEDAWQAVGAASIFAHGVETVTSVSDLYPVCPDGLTHLPGAGIMIYRDASRVAWCAWRLGGALVVWRCADDGSWEPTYEDAGFLVDGGETVGRWLTRMPDAGRLIEQQPNRLIIEVTFHRALHEEVTPSKLLLLRLLNLTVLQSRWVGDIFRRLVVRHLSKKGVPLPVKLMREIRFDSSSICVTDSFGSAAGLPHGLAKAPLWRCRRVTGNHMASASYYQPVEGLLIGPWAEQIKQGLGSEPTISFEIARGGK